MFRGSSNNNEGMSEAVIRTQWGSGAALWRNWVIVVVIKIWLYRDGPTIICLHISFISQYSAASERWIQEHSGVVIITEITVNHDCTAKTTGRRRYMPIHHSIIND